MEISARDEIVTISVLVHMFIIISVIIKQCFENLKRAFPKALYSRPISFLRIC